MTDELEIMFPNKDITLSNGQVVTVQPLKTSQLPKALAVVKSASGPLMALVESGAQDTSMVLEVMAAAGDDFLALVAMSIKKQVSYFDSLPADDGIALCALFVEVNGDFFIQKVLPAATKMMENLSKIRGAQKSSS